MAIGTLVKHCIDQSSAHGDAVKVTTYADNYTEIGRGFIIEKRFTITTGSTLYLLLDYTTYIPEIDEKGKVYVYPPRFTTSKGPVYVNVYRGTNYTGGTPIKGYNFNTLTPEHLVSKSTVYSGVSGTIKGTPVLEYLVGGDSLGNVAESGSTQSPGFFIRGNTDKSLVEIVNDAGSSITFHLSEVFYEV